MVNRGVDSTVSIIPTASNEQEQQKPPDLLLASLRGWVFRFNTPAFARHRAQAPEDVRACGFRELVAESTVLAVYRAS